MHSYLNFNKNMFKDRSFVELLDFNYDINHKVHGLIGDDEAHELFYEGFITKIFEPEHPKTIGSFEVMVYDLHKAKKLNKYEDIIQMIKELSDDDRIIEIAKMLSDSKVSLSAVETAKELLKN